MYGSNGMQKMICKGCGASKFKVMNGHYTCLYCDSQYTEQKNTNTASKQTYSGYISGDDVVQIPRGKDGIFSGATDVGEALSKALRKIRRQALAELKEAAYDLGCNAVIGVDFDYITLDPETANTLGGTTYLPYVFCVTANGNAVVIEKDE